MANKIENLKPFTKGDPRINRNGRPKSIDTLRKLAQQIANEPAQENGEAIVINGHVITVIESVLRSWARSKDPRLQIAFVEYAYGKVPRENNDSDQNTVEDLTPIADLILKAKERGK